MSGRRARQPEAKAARRAELKAAAAAALDAGEGLASFTMADLAARSGLGRGTPYKYFPSKESLLAELLLDDLEAWFAELVPRIQALGTPEAAVFAACFTDTLVARPRLLGQLAQLHAVIEPRLDEVSALQFKERLGAMLRAADADLRHSLPRHAPGEIAALLLQAHALVVGLVGMASPPPVLAKVLARPELAWMQVELAPALRAALTALVRGHG